MMSWGKGTWDTGYEILEPHSCYCKESCASRRDGVQFGIDVTQEFAASTFKVRVDVSQKRCLPLYQNTRRHTPNYTDVCWQICICAWWWSLFCVTGDHCTGKCSAHTGKHTSCFITARDLVGLGDGTFVRQCMSNANVTTSGFSTQYNWL